MMYATANSPFLLAVVFRCGMQLRHRHWPRLLPSVLPSSCMSIDVVFVGSPMRMEWSGVVPGFATIFCFYRGFKRRSALAMLAASSFEGVATVLATFPPTGGMPGRRNWRLYSLRDKQFHSIHERNGEGSGAPVHGAPHPTSAETKCQFR